MSRRAQLSLVDHFSEIVDPRMERNRLHSLTDIIVLTVCAVICGCETWEEIQEYGQFKQEWLKRVLPLANGIPSHDTIRRLFIRLNPEQLQNSFMNWVESVRSVTEGDVVAIDGKTLRRSGEAASGKSALHLVSAWSVANNMVLGQKKTEEASNEIEAIPALLELLKIKGCIVTIDAIGTQTHIAEKIHKEKKAEYVLAVKANQPTLHEEISYFFSEIDERDIKEGLVSAHKTVDKDHGRLEVRRYYASGEIDWLPELSRFHGVKSIAMVSATREIGERSSTQKRYFISSLEPDAKRLAAAIRGHWAIENTLHWTLDMSFREDDSRMREGYSPENFAMMRRMALSLMKRDPHSKRSLKGRRKICNWSDDYLERLLFNSDQTLALRPPGVPT